MSSLLSPFQEPAEQHASTALANYLDRGQAPEEAISVSTNPVFSLVRSDASDESRFEQPVQDFWAAIISRARTTPSGSSRQDRFIIFLTREKSSEVTGQKQASDLGRRAVGRSPYVRCQDARSLEFGPQ